MAAYGQSDDSGARRCNDAQLVTESTEVRGDGIVGEQYSTDAEGFESVQDGNGVLVVAGPDDPIATVQSDRVISG